MKKLIAVAAATLAVGCGQKNLKPEEINHAMPASNVIAITAPNPNAPPAPSFGAGGPSASLATPDAVVGKAPLAVSSYLLALSVNGGVFWALAPIVWFTQVVPPTHCGVDSCTWGPGHGAGELNTWMLVVTRNGDAYDYALSAAPLSTGGTHFVPVLTGRAWPGALPHRGHGTFHVDFDGVWAGLDHAAGAVRQDFGTIDVAYDARADVTVNVTFLNARNVDKPGVDPVNPNRINAAYAFAATATGGDLQVGWRTLPSGATEERAGLHTRWLTATGGRAELAYSGPAGTLANSQCWGGPPDYLMTYDLASATGSEAACVFATASPPTIVIP